MKYTVKAPVKDFTGEVAGVHLVKGTYSGELTPSALAYFEGAGYKVDRDDAPAPTPVSDGTPEAPSRNASQADWAEWVIATHPDAAPAEVRAMKRDDLRDKYGQPAE